MLPLDQLRATKTIIVHDSCADGLASALFLHDVLPEADLRFVQYSTLAYLNLEASPNMLFCDFSPPAERWEPFRDAGAMILDHHKKAKSIVQAFGENGVFADEVLDPGVCGAYLAYREVWCRLADKSYQDEAGPWPQRVAELAGIRDTWLNKHPDWKEACILADAMRFFPAETWLERRRPFDLASHKEWWDERIGVGRWLFEKNERTVQKALANSYRFTTTKGTRVVVFEGMKPTSDASDAMGDDADLIVGFNYFLEEFPEGRMCTLTFSTRSRTGFDCSALAAHYGGGGHTAAAGFSVRFDPREGARDPFTVIRDLVEKYQHYLDLTPNL